MSGEIARDHDPRARDHVFDEKRSLERSPGDHADLSALEKAHRLDAPSGRAVAVESLYGRRLALTKLQKRQKSFFQTTTLHRVS